MGDLVNGVVLGCLDGWLDMLGLGWKQLGDLTHFYESFFSAVVCGSVVKGPHSRCLHSRSPSKLSFCLEDEMDTINFRNLRTPNNNGIRTKNWQVSRSVKPITTNDIRTPSAFCAQQQDAERQCHDAFGPPPDSIVCMHLYCNKLWTS